eukprot:g4979.t1
MLTVPAPSWAMSKFEAFVTAVPVQLHGQNPFWQLESAFSSPSLGARGANGGPVASSASYSSVLGRRRSCSSCRRYGTYVMDSSGSRVGCGGRSRPAISRLKLQRQQRSRLWLPLASSSSTQAPTPTPTPSENGNNGAESDDAAVETGIVDAAVGSGGRLAGGTFESGTAGRSRPVLGWGAGDEAGRTSEQENFDEASHGSGDRQSHSSGMKGRTEGRLRLKWGLDIDIPVPRALEELVKGPWDPQGELWSRQLDMAAQVIARSEGVVFMEQLAPVLNPREGPPEWYRESATAGGGFRSKFAEGSVGVEVVGGEALMLQLLLELNGVPEVTDDGDILYVFPGFAGGEKARNGRTGKSKAMEAFEADQRMREAGEKGFTATPEILQFEEVPGLLDALPKMLPDQGPKVVKEFFQRTVLTGFALFLSTCLVLGQLIFSSWPSWLVAGPAYLIWVGLDDSLRRSRSTSAKQRDRWRGQWADACRGDGDAVWRKRAAASEGWVVKSAIRCTRSQQHPPSCSALPRLRGMIMQAHGVGNIDDAVEMRSRTSSSGRPPAVPGSGCNSCSAGWGLATAAGARPRTRAARHGDFKGWPAEASTQSIDGIDVGMDGDAGGARADEQDVQGAGAGGGPQVASGGGVVSSLDRFLLLLAADDTKKLGAWMLFALVLSRLRYFYGVMLGTFVMSYMGNTVIEESMRKGNMWLQRMSERVGWKRLPKKVPRSGYASVYILLLLTVITSLTVVIAPRLTVESQLLIQKLSEQDNPYAIIASWMRSNFGEEALTRLEPFLLSVTGDKGRIFAGYPDNSLVTIASKLRDKAAWGEERYARFAKLLQYCLSDYFKKGLNMCSAVVGGLTKVLYKSMVSLLFSFMVIWDLPNLRRGVKALKTSRLSFAYNTISPQVSTFAKLVGQSFEVQFTIAVINTILTTAGLIALGVSGPLVLSFIVFLCSFLPVIGVFISTLPMAVAALGDYGMSKVFQILLMIFGVHAVEAYFLNPQIYASKLKLHPVVVIGVLYVAEHLVGVQGLIIAVPCAVFVINNMILGNNGDSDNDGSTTVAPA